MQDIGKLLLPKKKKNARLKFTPPQTAKSLIDDANLFAINKSTLLCNHVV